MLGVGWLGLRRCRAGKGGSISTGAEWLGKGWVTSEWPSFHAFSTSSKVGIGLARVDEVRVTTRNRAREKDLRPMAVWDRNNILISKIRGLRE